MFAVILYLYISHVFGCDKEFSERNGMIDTFDQVSTSGMCTYSIKTPYYTRVKLTWERFNVDGIMPKCRYKDYVQVYVGCGQIRKVGVFCSSNMKSLPHDIYSPDNCIELWYSKSSEFGGFEARYSSYPENQPIPDTCNNMNTYITKLPAIVSSPGWPNKVYPGSCKWNINLGIYNKEIVVNIMDLNGYSYSSFDCFNKGSVDIKGIKSWYYCRRDREGRDKYFTTTNIVEYYEVDINFQNKHQFDNRGFVLGIVAYEKVYVHEASITYASVSVTTVVIAVLVVIAALLIIVCAIRRCRNRRLQRQQMQGQPMVVTETALQPTQGYPTQTYAAPSAPAPPYLTLPYRQPSPYDTSKEAASTPYPSYPQSGSIPPQEYPTNDEQPPPSYDVLYPTK